MYEQFGSTGCFDLPMSLEHNAGGGIDKLLLCEQSTQRYQLRPVAMSIELLPIGADMPVQFVLQPDSLIRSMPQQNTVLTSMY